MIKQDLINLLYNLTERVGLVDFYIHEASLLEKKESTLRICDFDDTIFWRRDQLASEEMLRLNRWDAGTTIITNTLWIEKYMHKYYKGVNYPKDIISLLNKESDVILTAGMKELQYMKIQATGLQDYNLRIVNNWEEKILETIRYFLLELKYIPSEIIVYEDRPQFFVKYRELIEWVLGTKLTIMCVEMDWNDGYKKIEELKREA
jgi:hypothetical protein